MRRVAILILLALLVCAGTASRAATATNSLVWNPATDLVSADLRGEALWPLLEDIAHQTGWHIFVEPGAARKSDVKFSDLPSGEALRKLLGDLNFAFVPKTNEASHLYVFTTTLRAATQRVSAATTNQTAVARHVANELVVKVKPGTDIDALAKSLGAKVVGRADKLGLYRLRFADEAAMETALGQLKTNPAVAAVEYNYLLNPPVAPQKIANAPIGPVSLTLNPPGDSGRVIVGMLDTHLQSMGSDLDQFMLKPISITGDTRTIVLKLFLRCSAISFSLRTTAKLFLVRNGWKSLKIKMAGSTCSMTWSNAAKGSLVAALRCFWDWMEVPAGTMPVL